MAISSQALVLAAAHVGELDPIGPGGGPGVEIDRDLEPIGDAGGERPGEVDAVVHRGLAERHERDDVDGPDPRVLAALGLHVDGLDGDGHRGLERVGHPLGLAGEGQDRPVVAGVTGPVEEMHAGRAGDGCRQTIDDVRPPALTEVRDGFDEPRHAGIVTRRRGRGRSLGHRPGRAP